MSFDIGIIVRSIPVLAQGAASTLVLVATALVAGTGLGVLACIGRLLERGLFYWICSAYIYVMRGIPEMLVMFWVYYCAPLVLDARLTPFTSAATAMSLYAGAFLAEIFRAGINAVPRGQVEAARALGIPEPNVWLEIIVPQAFRVTIPAILGLVTLVVKVSGLASIIGVGELVYQATIASGQSYRYFELFTGVGIFYLIMIFPVSYLAQMYERILVRRSQ
ncbi:MAG TPA: amino acid ABC transporter permease [Ramlibacter sp.]|uniref:amino acid ABC transporter permease n=1 Tax=Ramlibacter sp. TaxID=1917967 RepID=UPI002C379ACC|nr:amino acid ABC transporter permease [Ramlibacter sp.]HVZ44108.1 amino acid ABC transporter permease [Ramlibacter sp.]